jgi:hypothetical protein
MNLSFKPSMYASVRIKTPQLVIRRPNNTTSRVKRVCTAASLKLVLNLVLARILRALKALWIAERAQARTSHLATGITVDSSPGGGNLFIFCGLNAVLY